MTEREELLDLLHRHAVPIPRDFRRLVLSVLRATPEPTAPEPRETPLKCRWCGQTDWLTTEDIVAAYRAYGRAPESREAEPQQPTDTAR